PTLHLVTDPSSPRPARPSQPPPAPSSLPRVLLFIAAGLALLGVSQVRRLNGKGAVRARPVDATHDLLLLLFVGSGAAALIYEVVWLHLLRLVIGASALSVAIVLASFMGGMFLGSLLFARFVQRDRDPIRVYAMLEVGIGVFGLAMPIVLPAVRLVYVGLVGYGVFGIALRGLIAAILLLPPTALIGATPPPIARRSSRDPRGQSL